MSALISSFSHIFHVSCLLHHSFIESNLIVVFGKLCLLEYKIAWIKALYISMDTVRIPDY